MRPTTLFSAIVLTVSTAAIAQVGQAPDQQTLPANAAFPDDTTPSESNGSAANVVDPDASEPGAPSTALVNSVETSATATGRTPSR